MKMTKLQALNSVYITSLIFDIFCFKYLFLHISGAFFIILFNLSNVKVVNS